MIEIRLSDGTKMDTDLMRDKLRHKLDVAVCFMMGSDSQHAMVELDVFDIAFILIALDHMD